MPLNLYTIPSNLPVRELADKINSNNSLIKDAIDDLTSVIKIDTNTIKLTNFNTITDGGLEAKYAIFTAATGIAMSFIPSGGSVAVVTINVDGTITAVALSLSGNAAIGGNLVVAGSSTLENVTINGNVNFGPNAKIASKYASINVLNANTGSGGTAVDVSKADTIFLNYDNSGSALTNSGVLKIDLTTIQTGQIVRLYCIRTNSAGNSIYNGTTGNEIFAKIDVASGIISVTSGAVAFAPPVGGTAYMICQKVDIGGGNLRLLVLEHSDITGL